MSRSAQETGGVSTWLKWTIMAMIALIAAGGGAYAWRNVLWPAPATPRPGVAPDASVPVADFLARQGYKNVYNMTDGIVGWYRNGFSVPR